MVLLAHAITLLQSLNKTIHTQIRRRSPKIKAHWCIRIRQLPHQEQGNAGVASQGSEVTAVRVPRSPDFSDAEQGPQLSRTLAKPNGER